MYVCACAQVLGDDATEAFAQYHSFVNARELCAVLELGTLTPAGGNGLGANLGHVLAAGRTASKVVAAAPPPAAGIDGWVEGTVTASAPAGLNAVRLTVQGILPQHRADLVSRKPSVWTRGAHIMVALPQGLGSKIPARRPYTPFTLPAGGVVSPTPPGHFELLIRSYEHGILSGPLSELRVGSSLLYRGPLGGCIQGVRVGTRTLILLAGGTGITPMLQLLAPLCATNAITSSPEKVDKTKAGGGKLEKLPISALLLTFGHSRAQLLLAAELDAFGQAHAKWLGVRNFSADKDGRVCAQLLSKAIPKPDPSIQIFVCGPPHFNDAARAALAELGFLNTAQHGPDAAVHIFS